MTVHYQEGREPFAIEGVSFENVNGEFERKFRECYREAISRASGSSGELLRMGGENALDILESMANRMAFYDSQSDFDESFRELLQEYEPFTET